MTGAAPPAAVIQGQMRLDLATLGAGLGRRIEAVDTVDDLALDRGDMVEDVHKGGEGQVAHFAAPELGPPTQVQALKKQIVVASVKA